MVAFGPSTPAVAPNPWQFFPKAAPYNAKGDGKLIADASITSGQAIVTTVGIADPVITPTVSHANTGGTISAGVVQVKITYVTPGGAETNPSAAGSTTTTTGTSTVTVTAPAVVAGGSIGYHVYMTAVGGSTFFRQTQAGLPYPHQNNFVQTTPPLTSTPTPPAANTTQSSPFTTADVGKSVRLHAAGAASADLLTTISSYNSATSVTLAANAGTSVTAGGMIWGTDDTAAIQACMTAAAAYAAANNSKSELVFDPALYILATAPTVGGAFNGNCVLPLPSVPNGSPKAVVGLRGLIPDVADLPVYQQTWPQVSGTCLAYIGPAGTNNGTYGPAHVFGTPTLTSVYVTESGNIPGTTNIKASFDSFRIVVPWAGGIGGIDLFSAAQGGTYRVNVQALGTVPSGTGWTQIAANGPLTNQFGWGLRESAAGNNAVSYTEQYTAEGLCYGWGTSEHNVGVDVFVAYCVTGFESYAGNSIAMVHNAHILSGGVELSTNAIGALDGTVRIDCDNLRTESTSKVIFDPSNRLQGRCVVRDQNAGGAYKSGWANSGTGMVLYNAMTQPGPLSAGATGDPGVPATTVAWTNFYYKEADIEFSLAGGTLTSLTITGQGGTAVAQPGAVGAAAYRFRLPAGASYTPVYGAGTATHTLLLLGPM